MYQSEQLNELASALSKMQGTVGAVFKNKTAKVQMKSGGTYSYTYADLAGIWDAIRKPLMDAGLSISQTFVDNKLMTMLMHSSGQWLKSCLPLTCMGLKPQELGSEITYLRRYALTSILGISADEDEDGQIANEAQPKMNGNQNHVAESKAALQPPTINKLQAKELQSMLDECEPQYQNKFWNFLKTEVKGVESFDNLPMSVYPRIKTAISKKREDYIKEVMGLANV